jgi:hypothetical protein
MDVKYVNIINALTEINSELNMGISLEDIITIPENNNILKRELILRPLRKTSPDVKILFREILICLWAHSFLKTWKNLSFMRT